MVCAAGHGRNTTTATVVSTLADSHMMTGPLDCDRSQLIGGGAVAAGTRLMLELACVCCS
jgi:hypothetical protein